MTPTVGMALIVRDEADKIIACLDSFWDHVDQVAVLDTGCKDNTMDLVRDYAWNREGGVEKLKLGKFKWCHDFAAARNAADALLTTDWLCWIDADDILHGGEHLRPLAAAAGPELAAYGFDYDYAQDPNTGACVCRLRRERLVRRGAGTWLGAVHEAQTLAGPIQWLDSGLVEWRHRKPSEQAGGSGQRNLKILKAWNRREPNNPRVLAYLGTELAARGDFAGALKWFRRYLAVRSDWPDERAQVRRKMSGCHTELGELVKAEQAAWDAIRENPTWPDSYLTLAECAYTRGDWGQAEHYARQLLAMGAPDTLLIVNPLDYTIQPHIILAGALGEQGRYQEAIEHGQLVLQAVHHEQIQHALGVWQANLKRHETAHAFISAAQILVGHDEQAKALKLLEDCVPHFATDHPEVCAARSQLRERTLYTGDPVAYERHYREGGSKPEDFQDDDTSAQIAAWLPRSQFLVAGALEQLGVAA